MDERARREREDWAFEVVLLMRNRFLAHELYEERFSHRLSLREWNHIMDRSAGMTTFRQTMFRRLVPNLRAVGLLGDRVRARYHAVGLGDYVDLPSSDQLGDEAFLAA